MARIDGGWGFTYWQKDRLYGTSEADEIRANGGDDFVDGGDGNDKIWLGEGDDLALGGIGHDTIWGEDGADVIYGEENNDDLFGGNGNDRLFGGADQDELFGGGGNDMLDGGSGRDMLYGDVGNDTMLGGTGNDVLRDFDGSNRFDGGSDVGGGDIDTLDYGSLVGRVFVNLSTGTATADKWMSVVNGPGHFERLGISTVVNIEKVVGAVMNDALTGDGNANILVGASGEDTLDGGGGHDTISGGYGSDSLTGGEGRDAFLFDTLGTNANNPNVARDIVTDFNPAEDTLQFDNAVFTALGANGALNADAFYSTYGTFGPLQSGDAEDRLIYDTSTGDLFYDPDGTGSETGFWIARFDNRAALTVDDFQII